MAPESHTCNSETILLVASTPPFLCPKTPLWNGNRSISNERDTRCHLPYARHCLACVKGGLAELKVTSYKVLGWLSGGRPPGQERSCYPERLCCCIDQRILFRQHQSLYLRSSPRHFVLVSAPLTVPIPRLSLWAGRLWSFVVIVDAWVKILTTIMI